MAIRRFNDYETTKAYGDIQTLPKGGYVLKIMGAEVCENRNGQYIKISCDIAEGEFMNFFANEYRAQQSEDKKWHCNYLLNVPNDDGTEQDGWTKRRFKTVTEAMEEANSGYHFDWDEGKFKGKMLGVLFRNKEWEFNGKTGWTTECAGSCSVADIRSGDFKVPADKPLDNSSTQATNTSADVLADDEDDDLPFN